VTRIILATSLVLGAAACTGQYAKKEEGAPVATPAVTEPAAPGVSVSGYARVGVSTGS
jgi:hypothetical protein